jgi:hypothetical protein
MAITGLSEFTFGFAFLFEQAQRNWTGIRAAPILPSLRQEADDAWDAHLPARGTDYYYQFKLSDYLSRRNAKFRRNGIYNTPYYRVALHPRDNNRQHRRLRVHSRTHPQTYYVAPEFSILDDFNESFLAQNVTERSRLIPVADCDDIGDGDRHYLTYCQGDTEWCQHSEPKRHDRSITGLGIESLYRESQSKWQPLDVGFAASLFARTTATIDRLLGEEHRRRAVTVRSLKLFDTNEDDESRVSLLRRTADLLAVFYGATLVLVGSE